MEGSFEFLGDDLLIPRTNERNIGNPKKTDNPNQVWGMVCISIDRTFPSNAFWLLGPWNYQEYQGYLA